MKTRFRWILGSVLVVSKLFDSGSIAHAQPVPNSDQIQAQIGELAQQTANAAALKQPLDAARRALVRARDARAAGDVQHGIELEALAVDHVAIARTTLRALALEAALVAAQSKQIELENSQRQTETLLEVTVAQRERTRALLEQQLKANATKKAAETKPEVKKTKATRAK